MKIINIILMMSASFGLVYGQSINLDQTGSGHEVIIHQIGDNTINIEHSGNAQSADIYQEGELNTANVLQTKIIGYETYPGNNEAIIRQIGEENSAEINQISTSNSLGEIVQLGDRNQTIITQGTDEWPSAANRARIFQYGDDNEGFIDQQSVLNDALLTQDGNSNKAEISTSGDELHSTVNDIVIYQEGNDNYARADNGYVGTTGNIEQIGNNNSASQGLGASGNGGGAFGDIKQHQNNATAIQGAGYTESYGYIYQAASNPNASNYNLQYVSYLSVAIANVYGGDNYGVQKMFGGSYSYSHIEQEGDFNNTEIMQGEWSHAYVQTSGENSSYNNVGIYQGWDDWEVYGNSATVFIEGSYNKATITQEGAGNSAGISLDQDRPYILPFGIEIIGDHNEASILQQGDQNSADLHLIGDNMVLNIDQVGNNMTTSITQEN